MKLPFSEVHPALLSFLFFPFFFLFTLLFEIITLIYLFNTFYQVILCAYTVLCHGDSAVSRTQKVPVLMELTIWWKKTDKSQENKQDNFR